MSERRHPQPTATHLRDPMRCQSPNLSCGAPICKRTSDFAPPIAATHRRGLPREGPGCLTISDLEQNSSRIFDRHANRIEKLYGFASIDDSMVVGQGEVHHRTNDYGAVFGDRPFLNFMHAEDGALWRIQNRGRDERTEDAAITDRERTAGQFFDSQFTVARARSPNSRIFRSIS